MNLSVGDKIYVTDELIEGKLISFTDSHVTFECPEGFEYTFAREKVYRLTAEGTVENQPKFVADTPKQKGKKSFNQYHGVAWKFTDSCFNSP